MEINTELFIEEWAKVLKKLEQIYYLEDGKERGRDFTGLDIDENGVTYMAETYFSGCGTETFPMFISWNDINKPIEYFKKQIEKAKKDKEDLDRKIKTQEEQRKLKAEKDEYDRLKAKFG